MNKNEENVAILKDRNGLAATLKGVKVRGRLHGLLAEMEVEQSYTNPHVTNIEAVYTFPLPLGAVLLGLEVEIAGKTLSSSVVEREQAERDYEDAVTNGDSAVMLEEAGPGLYTASLGNLMAKESAVIRYRYGLLLSWQGPRLRFLVPTTIAPRYGDALAAGLQPHQVPIASLEVEYPLDLSITVEGDLASAAIASPSHVISMSRTDNGIVVRLSGHPVLDRDFVLTLESDKTQSSCVLVPDGEGQVALASLRIPPIESAEKKPIALKVVIDCSGSMGGTSIAQARKAALDILDRLKPEDSFNVTLFGSQYQHLFSSMAPATAKYITEAWNRLEKLDAEMGGTEMEAALEAVFSLSGPEGDATILLITDGEIQEHEKLVKRAKKSGHRIFVVGVGTAVAEAFLHSLADATDGACELVAPQEGMAERVVSQFYRMRQPKLDALRIEWPTEPAWVTPLPKTVFAGDTVHVFAGFRDTVAGSVSLLVQGAGKATATIAIVDEREIPRIAASRRMELATDAEGLLLALEHQLLSRWTNYLVIAERADKAQDLPALHLVPQMLAAGWGGTGSIVQACRSSDPQTRFSVAQGLPAVFQSGRSGARNAAVDSMTASGIDKYDVPAFLRKQAGDGLPPMSRQRSNVSFDFCMSSAHDIVSSRSPAEFIAEMERALASFLRQPKLPTSIDQLEKWELDEAVAKSLRSIVARGHDEVKVVAAFIFALTQSGAGPCFSRSFKRAVLKAWKHVVPGREIDRMMLEALAAVTATAWNRVASALAPAETLAAAV